MKRVSMSIFERLRKGLLRLRPRHDKPTRNSQLSSPSAWKKAARRFTRLFRSKSNHNSIIGYGVLPHNIPPLPPQPTFCPSFFDLASDSFAPTKLIDHIPNAEVNQATNICVTESTSSDLSSIVFAPAKFSSHISNAEGDEVTNVLAAEQNASEFFSPSFPPVEVIGHLPGTEGDKCINISTAGATTSELSSTFFSPAEFVDQTCNNEGERAATNISAARVAASEELSASVAPVQLIDHIPHAEGDEATSIPIAGGISSDWFSTSFAPAGSVDQIFNFKNDSATNFLATEAAASEILFEIANSEDGLVTRVAFLALPVEILQVILGFVLSSEPPYAPTHLRLLAPRHVCRLLRTEAETVMWKTLNAPRRLLYAGQNSEMREWFKRGADLRSQYSRQAVSFQLDTNRCLDLDLSRHFAGALLNCRQARVEIQVPVDLFGQPNRTIFTRRTTTTAAPPSRICDFSWTSAALGIRDPIPLNLKFPWPILVDDLPWSQLTHLSLDCPLSDLDALEVLSKGRAAFECVSLKLTETKPCPLNSPVALPSLHSLTIDTRVPVRNLFAKILLSALKNLELKCPITTEEESAILNEHLNIPWNQLKKLSLLNRDTWERRRCPVTAILMKCSQLERFRWDGYSDTFETSTALLSFVMSQTLEELVIKSDSQGCQVLLEKLSYPGNPIRRVTVSYFDDLNKLPHAKKSLPHWTQVTISDGVSLFGLSHILKNGRRITKAAFQVVEGATPTDEVIPCPRLQELELRTSIRTPSLWKRLEANRIQSVQVVFGGGVLNRELVLDDMAPFLQHYQSLPFPKALIIPAHIIHSSPYALLNFND